MKKSIPLILAILLPLTAVSILLGCIFGSADIFTLDGETAKIILFNLRLPRVFAALLAGMGLALSGVLLQSVTGNPLAAPNIIGVNSGAGFFCIVMLSFLPSAMVFLPFGAFAGAFLSTLVIVGVSYRVSTFKGTVILAGVALSAILNAGISLLSLLDSDVLSAYNAFSIGGLSGVKTGNLIIPAVIVAFCFVISLILSKRINTLCLGDSVASALGVRVRALRLVCLVLASASAAAAVSFAGLLGFVGLIVPHIARRIFGAKTSHLVLSSALIGANLVILADLFGRVLLAPTEIPVGVIMALIGAPFFFILLLKRRKNNA